MLNRFKTIGLNHGLNRWLMVWVKPLGTLPEIRCLCWDESRFDNKLKASNIWLVLLLATVCIQVHDGAIAMVAIEQGR